MALSQNAIDYEAKDVSEADVTIVSLFPPTIISFIKENADLFKEGSIVIDTGGIKKAIVDEVTPILAERGVTFIGVHPMAGREFSGFEYSLDDLFDNASFIMTPTENTPQEEINLIEDLARSIHFKKVVKTTPEEHDRIIAFTSQLAHVVSNAYIKSPTHQQFALQLRAKHPNVPVGIIQTAWGGTPIRRHIRGGDIYANHTAPLKDFHVAGVLWYQGCDDAMNFSTATEYESQMTALINQYRSVFGRKDLPFLYVQLARWPNYQ